MKLSIISINYNSAADLERTIQSIQSQTWKDFEYIIIDGGSSDNSVAVIKQYADHIHYWVSERDKGVFNAMNKGIEKASGEYLLMLNAGDVLHDEKVLENIFGQNLHQEDILYGDVLRESNGKVFAKSIFPDKLPFSFLKSGTLSHQAMFIRKNLHDEAGLYDEDMKFSSDWKFTILAICKYNATYKHLPLLVAICNTDGLTCNPANFPAMKQEFEDTLLKCFPAFTDDYAHLDKLSVNYYQVFFRSLKRKVKSALKMLTAK